VSNLVLTLIAAKGDLARDIPIEIATELSTGGAEAAAWDWLAASTACDIVFAGIAGQEAEARARRVLAGRPVDILVQPLAGRRKRLLVADMESTIIENEMLDDLADFLGMREVVAEITRRAMNGEIDFVAALEARVALLKGLPEGVLAAAAARIRITPGAAALVATMRGAGAAAILVSGGFRVFASGVREQLGFDGDIANELVVENGQLAGTVRPPIVTRETKLAALRALAIERGLQLSETLAVGDGANDLPMLQAAGLGIAFRAKPAVAAAARARIDHGDLTALLYAQGYRAAEILGS
jgi:phosphoserine phosphatase